MTYKTQKDHYRRLFGYKPKKDKPETADLQEILDTAAKNYGNNKDPSEEAVEKTVPYERNVKREMWERMIKEEIEKDKADLVAFKASLRKQFG